MRKNQRNNFTFNSLIIGLVFIVIIGIGVTNIRGVAHTNTYVVTITDKQVKNSKDTSKYLVFTELENGETRVFENTDQLLVGKFNSSDVFSKIKVGNKYKIKAIGYRVAMLSMYENIKSVEEVK